MPQVKEYKYVWSYVSGNSDKGEQTDRKEIWRERDFLIQGNLEKDYKNLAQTSTSANEDWQLGAVSSPSDILPVQEELQCVVTLCDG